MNNATTITIADSLAVARRRLGAAGVLDAEVLLSYILGTSRTYLHTWPERMLTDEEKAAYEELVERRARGEPVAYLTGRREFWSMELGVTPATLIPRADTEILVGEALGRIAREAPARVADLGTGSGAIALAIARERPASHVIATDLSQAALAVAAENARRFGFANVSFRQGEWFGPLAGERFDLIVSNPPYVAEGDPHLAMGDLRFEPRSALASGADGLSDLRRIIAEAPGHLAAGGWLLLEHGCDQGFAVRRLMEGAGLTSVETRQDLEGRDRVTLGQAAQAGDA